MSYGSNRLVTSRARLSWQAEQRRALAVRQCGRVACCRVSPKVVADLVCPPPAPGPGITPKQIARRRKAIANREKLLCRFKRDVLPVFHPNGDEELPGFWGSYSKALPHTDAEGAQLGLVIPSAYELLRRAECSGSPADWAAVPLGTDDGRRLANPQAAWAYTLIGSDSWMFTMPAAPSVTSAEAAAELVELYAMTLVRDVPFNDYATDAVAGQMITYLNELQDFTAPKQGGVVTAQTLFRGNSDGALTGLYLSQFLMLPVRNGAQTNAQQYVTRAPGDDFMTTVPDVIAIQNGAEPAPAAPLDPQQYIVTARNLAEYVHSDFPMQAYQQAALILGSVGAPPNPGSPYSPDNSKPIENQSAFVTFGMADVLSFLGSVTRVALQAAWVQKWVVQRRLRPEAMALRNETNRTGATNFALDTQVNAAPGNTPNPIVTLYIDAGLVLLPQAYPEGSPTHPSYPAGHAVVAGACVTVLKAFFDGARTFGDGAGQVNLEPLTGIAASARGVEVLDATTLGAYAGVDDLTVAGELNKLAENVAIGRDLAGVHYRSDGDQGLLLGEQVALRALRDLKCTYSEPLCDEWAFTGLQGNRIVI